MAVMTRTRFDVVPLTQHIGAEIRGLDLREQPDETTTRAILSGLARSSRHRLSRPEAVAGRLDPRDRVFR